MRLPKLLRRLPSILMGQHDPSLVKFERRLRRHLAATGFPEIWRPPAVHTATDNSDAMALLHLFHAFHLGQSADAKAVDESREAYGIARAPDLKARALEYLTDALMKTILNEYSKQEGPLDKARSEECLELCRRGIEEFQHFAWAPNVIGSFHLVHGTIDVYLGESLGAKLHLKRALAEAESVTTRFDRMARNESRAWAHVSLGDLAAMESAWDEACNHYETARRLSKDIIKLAAVSRLANIYLEFLKNPKMALRVLVRVQGKLGLLVEKDPVRDEIRWQTAKSYWLCGRKMHSMKLYRAIAKDADSEKLKKQVGEWLKKVSESKGKRRIPDG